MKPNENPDPYTLDDAKAAAPAAAEEAAPKPAASATFDSTPIQGVHVIMFDRAEVLDGQYIERLGDDLYHHIREEDAPRMVIDLENVTMLSSAALGMLVRLHTVVTKKKTGKICVCNVSGDIKQVFKIMKFHKLMPIHDGVEKAIKSLA